MPPDEVDESRLTTTSYAVLTQLALRPWSPYQLVQQRVRYFRYAWPSAESAIYREMKRLADLGFAEGTEELTGKRSRTVYSITAAGLEALRAWLETSVSPFALEFEAMVRLFAIPVGEPKHMLTTLTEVRDDAREMLEFAADVRREFLEGRNPLQDQVYVRALAVDFFVHLLRMVDSWAERTMAHMAEWEGHSLEERNARGLEILRGLPLSEGTAGSTDPTLPPPRQDRR